MLGGLLLLCLPDLLAYKESTEYDYKNDTHSYSHAYNRPRVSKRMPGTKRKSLQREQML